MESTRMLRRSGRSRRPPVRYEPEEVVEDDFSDESDVSSLSSVSSRASDDSRGRDADSDDSYAPSRSTSSDDTDASSTDASSTDASSDLDEKDAAISQTK